MVAWILTENVIQLKKLIVELNLNDLHKDRLLTFDVFYQNVFERFQIRNHFSRKMDKRLSSVILNWRKKIVEKIVEKIDEKIKIANKLIPDSSYFLTNFKFNNVFLKIKVKNGRGEEPWFSGKLLTERLRDLT